MFDGIYKRKSQGYTVIFEVVVVFYVLVDVIAQHVRLLLGGHGGGELAGFVQRRHVLAADRVKIAVRPARGVIVDEAAAGVIVPRGGKGNAGRAALGNGTDVVGKAPGRAGGIEFVIVPGSIFKGVFEGGVQVGDGAVRLQLK